MGRAGHRGHERRQAAARRLRLHRAGGRATDERHRGFTSAACPGEARRSGQGAVASGARRRRPREPSPAFSAGPQSSPPPLAARGALPTPLFRAARLQAARHLRTASSDHSSDGDRSLCADGWAPRISATRPMLSCSGARVSLRTPIASTAIADLRDWLSQPPFRPPGLQCARCSLGALSAIRGIGLEPAGARPAARTSPGGRRWPPPPTSG